MVQPLTDNGMGDRTMTFAGSVLAGVSWIVLLSALLWNTGEDAVLPAPRCSETAIAEHLTGTWTSTPGRSRTRSPSRI